MSARLLPLDEAVAELVQDGDTVALEGFTHLIPVAAGHEIIRQRRRDLTLVRMTPDLVYDQLIGAGCARKLIFSRGGNPGVGSLHRFRDAIEHGWPAPLEIEEHSHAGTANRYVAAARALRDGALCFVGIGRPSTAANLARRTHAPNHVLIYESLRADAYRRAPRRRGGRRPSRHRLGLAGRPRTHRDRATHRPRTRGPSRTRRHSPN